VSVIEDTIRWAEEMGIDVPGFDPNGSTTIENTVRELQRAEQAFLANIPNLVQARIQGVLKQVDRDRYTTARRDLFLAQVRFYDAITDSRVMSMLRALGGGGPVPYPTMAPDVSVLLGPASAGVAGLGAAPLAVPASALWIGGVIGAVAVGFAISIAFDAISSAFQARVNSEAHARTLATRMAVYIECVNQGTESREECARIARALGEQMPPGATAASATSRIKTAAKWVAATVVLGSLGYVAVKFYGARATARGSRLSGLGGGGKPRKLTSLEDDYPSRYFLEI